MHDLEGSLLNLNNSFADLGGSNMWRVNVVSYLKSGNREFYLLKECRAEIIGKHPFFVTATKGTGKGFSPYEFLCIAEKPNSMNTYRTSSADLNVETLSENTGQEFKLNLQYENVKFLDFEEVHDYLKNKININIFCEIRYEFEGEKNVILTKCEYINYSSELDEKKFCQPIMGYVPFILNNKINVAYVVNFIEKDNSGNLEFLLREKTPLFNQGNGKTTSRIIKTILNKLLFFVAKNDFTKYIIN
jgi:hypothetical protein